MTPLHSPTSDWYTERVVLVYRIGLWANKYVVADSISVPVAYLANSLLAKLTPDLPLPHLSHSSDGEVIFNWTSTNQRLEAGLDSDLHLTWVIDSNMSDTRANVELGQDLDCSANPSEQLDSFVLALRQFLSCQS